MGICARFTSTNSSPLILDGWKHGLPLIACDFESLSNNSIEANKGSGGPPAELYISNEQPSLTQQSVVPLRRSIDHAKARFRMLRRLPNNYDNEGASAPNSASVDAAIAFLDRLTDMPGICATLSDAGSAVIEIDDTESGFFGEITFLSDNKVECYRRRKGAPSVLIEGTIQEAEIKRFLVDEMGINL